MLCLVDVPGRPALFFFFSLSKMEEEEEEGEVCEGTGRSGGRGNNSWSVTYVKN